MNRLKKKLVIVHLLIKMSTHVERNPNMYGSSNINEPDNDLNYSSGILMSFKQILARPKNASYNIHKYAKESMQSNKRPV